MSTFEKLKLHDLKNEVYNAIVYNDTAGAKTWYKIVVDFLTNLQKNGAITAEQLTVLTTDLLANAVYLLSD
jgi:hypothetical protein